MARALVRYAVKDDIGNAIANAAVNIYRPGTTTAPFGAMYDAESGGSVITNPLITTSQGEAIAWLDTPQIVDITVTSNGGQAYYPRTPSVRLGFGGFTEAKIPVVSGPSTTLAIGATPSAFAIENHDAARNSFVVQGDNGDGNGNREWFAVENSNPGPNDMNFRNVILNIGDTSTAVQKHGIVTANFLSPSGSSGQYIRGWAPGVTNTNPACFSIGVNGNLTLAVGGLSSTALVVKAAADAQSRMVVDEFGKHSWGPGGSTATDTTFERSAANVLATGTDDAIKTGAFAHGSLPTPSGYAAGAQVYCTTDKKPVWSDGSAHWVDAAGANHT